MIGDEECQGVVSLDRVVKKVSLRRLLPKTSLSKEPRKGEPGGVSNMGNILTETKPVDEQGGQCGWNPVSEGRSVRQYSDSRHIL